MDNYNIIYRTMDPDTINALIILIVLGIIIMLGCCFAYHAEDRVLYHYEV